MRKQRKSKLSRKDRMDILVQLGRYERECGDVHITHVDPAIFKQSPVAVVSMGALVHAQA